MNRSVMAVGVLMVAAGSAMAGPTVTRTEANLAAPKAADNVLSADEYGIGNSQVYAGATNGSGFGGYVGNSRLYFAADATNLYIGWQPGADLGGNLFAVQFNNSGNGNFNSSADIVDDASDGGRRASTFASFNGQVNFPIASQFSLVFGDFGAVLFELTPDGGNPNQISFRQFSGSAGGGGATFREIAINWNTIGGFGSFVDFFGYGVSDSGFVAGEGIPSFGVGPDAGGGNPGFGDGSALNFTQFNRFEVPTPGAAALLGLGGLVAARRRR